MFSKTEIAVGVVIAALVVGAIALLVALGGASCPKGQHTTVLYYQPVVTTINGTTSVSMTPVYGCVKN